MEIKMIHTMTEFMEMEELWASLIERMESPDIFDTWEWAYTCFNHMVDKDAKLFLMLVIDQGKGIGLAPFCLVRRRVGLLTVKVLQPINYGTAAYSRLYLDKHYNSNSVVKLFIEELNRHKEQWDVLELRNFNTKDHITYLIQQFFGSKFIVHRDESKLTSCVNFSCYSPLKLNAGEIKKIEQREKKLHRDYQVNVMLDQPFSERIWERMTELHKAKWEGSMFLNQSFLDFCDRLLPILDRKDQLGFSYIEIDGEIEAVSWTLYMNKKAYCEITNYSKQYAHYGIGLILTKQVLTYLHEQGMEEYDFLHGSETYKFYWADTIRRNYDFYIYNNGKQRYYLNTYMGLKLAAKQSKLLRRMNEWVYLKVKSRRVHPRKQVKAIERGEEVSC
jgi:hypothetical protein